MYVQQDGAAGPVLCAAAGGLPRLALCFSRMLVFSSAGVANICADTHSRPSPVYSLYAR